MELSEELMAIERRLAAGRGREYDETLATEALVIVPSAVLDKAQCVAAMDASHGWDEVSFGAPRLIRSDAVATVVYRFEGVRGDTRYTAVLSSSYHLPEKRLFLHQQTPEP